MLSEQLVAKQAETIVRLNRELTKYQALCYSLHSAVLAIKTQQDVARSQEAELESSNKQVVLNLRQQVQELTNQLARANAKIAEYRKNSVKTRKKSCQHRSKFAAEKERRLDGELDAAQDDCEQLKNLAESLEKRVLGLKARNVHLCK